MPHRARPCVAARGALRNQRGGSPDHGRHRPCRRSPRATAIFGRISLALHPGYNWLHLAQTAKHGSYLGGITMASRSGISRRRVLAMSAGLAVAGGMRASAQVVKRIDKLAPELDNV